MVSAPAQVSRLARIAIQHAVGRRGAAVLVLPGDGGDIPLSEPTELSYGPVAPALVQPSDEAVHLLADRLDAAETVAIFGGIGRAGAREELDDIRAAPLAAGVVSQELEDGLARLRVAACL